MLKRREIMMTELKHAENASKGMSFVPGRILAMGLVGLVLFAGCRKQPETPAAPAETPQSSAAQPPVTSEPGPAATPGAPPPATAAAPVAPPAAAPRAVAPAPQPVTYTIPAGTPVVIRTSSEISAKNNNVGDSFSGTLVQSLSSKGVTLIRAGAPVSGTVTAAKGQGKFKGAGDLAISLRAIGSRSVSTSAYEKIQSGKGKRTTGMIAGGGGAGALIGGLAGGGKGALIGGLIGAGAGTAGAAYTGNKNVVIPAESTVTFTLTAPISVTVTAKEKAAAMEEQPQ